MGKLKKKSSSEKSTFSFDKVDDNKAQNEADTFLAFDYSPIPVLIYNLDTLKFVHVNNTAMALFGFTKEEFSTMNIKQVLPKKAVPGFVGANEKVKTATSPLHFDAFPHLKKDGTIMLMDVTIQKIPYLEHSCALISGMDVTEKEQIISLERLERKIMELSMDLNYELKDLLLTFTKGLEEIFPGMKASILKIEYNK